MDRVKHFVAEIGNWSDLLSQPRGQAVTLLLGLGALALCLLVLMLTRFGQVKPLSKCIVLSVFAHVLLMAYAYGIRFLNETPPKPREEVITVTLVAPEHQPPEKEQPEAPTPESTNQTSAFLAESETLPDSVAPTEPARLDAEPQEAEPLEAPAPVPGEPPAADPLPPLEQADPEPPESPEPERLTVDTTDPTPKRTTDTDQVPDVIDSSDDVQRLSDLPFQTPTPEAMADVHDDTEHASDEDPSAPSDLDSVAGDDDSSLPLVPVVTASVSSPVRSDPTPVPTATKRAGDGRNLPATYRARMAANRGEIAARNGGSAQTEAAVDAALAWLAENQGFDGRWDCSMHGGGRETTTLGHDRNGAGAEADTAITGLAILAFLAAGHTHLDGEYDENVQHGLEYLLRTQAADGNLAGASRVFARMYCHGIATLALSEAYAMTGDPRIRPYVERAVQYTIRAQNPTDGGWRYQPGDRGDTSQLGWQLMALKSAELAGISIPGQTRGGMIRFLNSVAAGRHRGLASYRPRAFASRTMTAESLACRLFLELNLAQATTDEAVTYLLQETPQAGPMNLYYWYYATMALFQIGGSDWDTWNAALTGRLLATQETSGQTAGSWSPETVWGGYGGRVYSTAMAALCLEVYYRYLPVLE